jgi:urea transport system permease protein
MPWRMKTRDSRPGQQLFTDARIFTRHLIGVRTLACAALIAVLLTVVTAQAAVDQQMLKALGGDDADAKIEVVGKLVATADPAALAVLQAMSDDTLVVLANGVIAISSGTALTDAATGAKIPAPAEAPDSVSVNNRVRGAVQSGLAAMSLLSPDRETRLKSAKSLQNEANGATIIPLLDRALQQETDPEIKAIVELTRATLQLKDPNPEARLAAVKALANSGNPNLKIVFAAMLEKGPDGQYNEPDEKVRAAAAQSLRELESKLFKLELLGGVFYGLSLGSILLLVALGLAITFGLMGIINMAHGELLMIGAYATFVVQNIFKANLPNYFDWYLLSAVPVAFLASAVVGMLLERTVIRWLYGRPLETLLATWGISLILIQTVRTFFGAQNVEVANPSWMSGGVALGGDLVLPYNRIIIVGFAAFVLFLVWLMLNRTRLGLFVRAVTQNRAMADCVGVPTNWVDMLTFGIGSGIAGLGGCALSQIGNVGPEMGQGYIVDSFMVVVLGGVGQLAGTVIAALGLGEVNKFLEPQIGAVLAKIVVLVFIIIFIQKRPQGLFALKGRSAEA